MDEHLDFAKSLALDAGVVIKRYFQAEDIGLSMKQDKTPLTIADTTINDNVIAAVKKHFPDHGVLGEETSYKPERKLVWVLDPIDGTVPFTLNIPVSTFSLALVDRKDGQPLVGVVYDPFLNHMYYAAKDGGAYRDDTKIRTNPQKTLDSGYISVLGFRWKKLGSTIDTIYTKEGRVVSLISHAYAAAKVASGELIGAILAYGSPWDNAASALIVQKAGGVVTDLNGQPRRYDDFADGCVLSCNQDVHKELLKIVKNANNRH